MKTRRALLALLLPLSMIVASCTPQRGTSHEIITDLHNYSTELQKWEPKEQEIFQAIDDVDQSQYVDDEFVVRTLKSKLPALDEHIREVAAYQPATSELVGLHGHYRKGWEELRAAVDAMISAESKKDYLALAKAKSQMTAARAILLKSFATMDALMEETDQAQNRTHRS
jgi:hypothetical protein